MNEINVDMATIVDAFTVGGGVIFGLVLSFALAAYRRRAQLAELDTIQEFFTLASFVVMGAGAAMAALPESLGGWQRVGAAAVIALFSALKMNSGALPAAPESKQ